MLIKITGVRNHFNNFFLIISSKMSRTQLKLKRVDQHCYRYRITKKYNIYSCCCNICTWKCIHVSIKNEDKSITNHL